ncbi:MAG: hypothetical protein IJA60_03910 [Clostridia bacterium]|nr:hypothetical protein [Clostridia bacterium]
MSKVFSEELCFITPQSLSDCQKVPRVAEILWSWARILEIIGIVLFWLLTVAGIITGMVIGSDYGDILPFLMFAGGGVLAGAIEYCTCFIIALGLGAISTIVYNTSVSAKAVLYQNNCEKSANVTEVAVEEPIADNVTVAVAEKIIAEPKKAKTKPKAEADTSSTQEAATVVPEVTKLPCPHCREDIGFMEFSEEDIKNGTAVCPFCNALIKSN